MSVDGAALQRVPFPPREVDPGAIERELAELWNLPGPDEAGQPVTRACMSNLIIVCDDEAKAEAITQELGELVERHPSRVLLLIAGGDAVDELGATVSALCYRVGAGRQVCAEQVRLAAPERARRRLPSLVRPLLIGDLPTALFWASATPPVLEGELFPELAALAGHVLYDSHGWPDPAGGVIATADWAFGDGRDVVVSDLAWPRLRGFRRLIAESLDPGVRPGALDRVESLAVEHGPHALPEAWLLCGWLARALGWRAIGGDVEPGNEVSFGFDAPDGRVRARLRRLADAETRIRSAEIRLRGGGGPLRVREVGAGCLALRAGEGAAERVLAAAPEPRASALAWQLAERRADPVFRDALAASLAMARALRR